MFDYWKFKRKRLKHYKNKITLTQMQIWDLEFLREKTKAVREGIRMDYDRITELCLAKKHFRDLITAHGLEKASELLKAAPTAEPNATVPDQKAELTEEDHKVLDALNAQINAFETDIAQMRTQMDAFDGEVPMQQGNGELQLSVPMINAKIEGHQTVMGLLKQYIKKL